MNIALEKLHDISKEPTLRCDYDYHRYKSDLIGDYYKFTDLFEVNNRTKVNIDDLFTDFSYCEISNVDKDGDIYPEQLNFNKRDLPTENYYKKIEEGDIIKVREGDILLSKVRPNLRKFVRITSEIENCYFTSAFISLRPKILPVIMYYALRTVFYQSLVAISRQGKGYPTLNVNDLVLMQFDKATIDVLKRKETEITRYILGIEDRIKRLKATIQPASEIIDNMFSREFSFDYATFKKLKEKKIYTSSFTAFSNNDDLRFSAKFHRDAAAFVQSQLAAITSKKIKNYLAEPILLGASISPCNYMDGGEYFYISMATIKNWFFDREAAQTITNEYAEEQSAKTVRKNDIIMARSGEGTIGKVALIDDEELQGVFADFTMRIRLKGYNHLFAYYYFRSAYFQYLIEVYKKGLGNNTNIFPSDLHEFPIIDVPEKEQERIVNEIQTELEKQVTVKNEIAVLRKQIEEIIYKEVKEGLSSP